MNDLLDHLFDFNYIDAYANQLVLESVLIAEALALMFFIIAFAWNMLSTIWNTMGKQAINIQAFGRALIMMFLIGVYIPLAQFPKILCEVIAEATAPSTTEIAEYSGALIEYNYEGGFMGSLDKEFSLIEEERDQVTDEEDDGGQESMSLWNFFDLTMIPSTLMSAALDGVTAIIVALIRLIVFAITKVLIVLFYVIGPYAIAASILGIWKDKLAVWFNTYVTMLFVPIIFNILDRIVYFNFFSNLLSLGSGEGYTPHQSLAINIGIIVLYILPFWVAGKVVGSADAGRFLSTAVGAATTAASAGLGKIGGLAGRGLSAGRTDAFDKASNISKDVLSS